MTINITVTGLDNLKSEIISQLRRIASESAYALATYEEEVFATEGAINGQRWKNISDKTKKKRQRMGVPPDNPILQARGVLKSSYKVSYTTELPVLRASLEFADLYTVWDSQNLNLAAVHHYGYGKRYPRRPLFDEQVVEARMEGFVYSLW